MNIVGYYWQDVSLNITRFVHQGCPLSPLLLPFFAEARTMFFNNVIFRCTGLALPKTRQAILKAEFADGTTMPVEGMLNSL
jgi:hypothetical protein